MRPIVFPYKLLGGRWSPMISAGIRVCDRWQPIELFVDSGATYTILRAQTANDAGLDFTSGRKVFAQVGDGSLIPVYLHDLPIQIGGVSFRAPIGFSQQLGVAFNLLGRLGVFEHFKICFHERQRVVSFLPCV
jgi:gag-polyprotein putative aspartyl protease